VHGVVTVLVSAVLIVINFTLADEFPGRPSPSAA
jgi:hypothetical protein